MRVAATLTIKVTYDDAESLDEIREQLRQAAEHLASVGLLSGDGAAIVATWSAETTARPA